MSLIQSIEKQFIYYKSLADKTIAQLSEEQVFWRANEESNSIAMIMKHLAGNMLSRWTDFRTSDGEKEWRNREGEFADDINNLEELTAYWEKGWACLMEAITSVDDTQLNDIIYIRNQGHSIIEAINRQLAHYPYHIGQIVFIGKMLVDEQWQSLSIPRGGSKSFNADKFAKEKGKGHYTDEFL